MATTIYVPPDRRTEILGEALGQIGGLAYNKHLIDERRRRQAQVSQEVADQVDRGEINPTAAMGRLIGEGMDPREAATMLQDSLDARSQARQVSGQKEIVGAQGEQQRMTEGQTAGHEMERLQVQESGATARNTADINARYGVAKLEISNQQNLAKLEDQRIRDVAALETSSREKMNTQNNMVSAYTAALGEQGANTRFMLGQQGETARQKADIGAQDTRLGKTIAAQKDQQLTGIAADAIGRRENISAEMALAQQKAREERRSQEKEQTFQAGQQTERLGVEKDLTKDKLTAEQKMHAEDIATNLYTNMQKILSDEKQTKMQVTGRTGDTQAEIAAKLQEGAANRQSREQAATTGAAAKIEAAKIGAKAKTDAAAMKEPTKTDADKLAESTARTMGLDPNNQKHMDIARLLNNTRKDAETQIGGAYGKITKSADGSFTFEPKGNVENVKNSLAKSSLEDIAKEVATTGKGSLDPGKMAVEAQKRAEAMYKQPSKWMPPEVLSDPKGPVAVADYLANELHYSTDELSGFINDHYPSLTKAQKDQLIQEAATKNQLQEATKK